MQYFLLFLEGIITFISPCLLPMIPIYISYFAGGKEKNTAKTLLNAISFVLGFTLVFVAMGALGGGLGGFFIKYRIAVNIITGLIVIIMGLGFMGAFELGIFRGMNMSVKSEKLDVFSSLLFGMIFSIGWTPCVGAMLGSALAIASRAEDEFVAKITSLSSTMFLIILFSILLISS